jgi:ABC-2 type transport system ATP-binding protein
MINLRVENVTTVLDNKQLIENISLTVEKGEVLALVGHNGAGKSTLLKTIMNTLQKESGNIIIEETYSQDDHLLMFKEKISYLPEEPMLLSELTVMQHFQLYSMSYEIDEQTFKAKLQQYLQGLDLTEALDVYPEQLSKGMRQKAQAICSLLPDVPVLLIDEPFMGLDVYAKEYMLDLIEQKKQQGTSIILTTHQLELLEGIATSFVILQDGKVVSQGPIHDFETIKRRTDND